MSPQARRWTQLRALAATRPGFAAIADGMIDPECGALSLAEAIPQLEAMLTRVGMELPAPEPEPAVETLAECLAALALPEPTPRLVPLAGGSNADPVTRPPRAAPSYAQVEAVFLEHCGPDLLAKLTELTPDPAARRARMLSTLREQAALWLEPLGVCDRREPDSLLANMGRGGMLLARLDAWDRGEGCETEPATSGKIEPAANNTPVRSAAAVEARERQALGAKGAKPARASRIKATQQKAIAKARADDKEPHYLEGGYAANMPNLVLDLIAPMSAPVAKGYLVSLRLADQKTGSFEVSHQTLARWIGGETRQHGERVMRRLVDAGLIHQRWRGGPGRPNGYRLASLARLNVETARAVLMLPLTESGANKHRRRLLDDATGAVA